MDESKWVAVSLGVALLSAIALLLRYRRSAVPIRRRMLAAMNLLFGVTIGTLALGHLAAVATKHALRTLDGPAPVFYAIGLALAVPSWWLVSHTRRVLTSVDGPTRATLGLNAWLAITLLALGIHNLPLATPGLLNVGYQLCAHRALSWVVAILAVMTYVGLFSASLVFLASGQSFEQFRGSQ